MLLWHVSINNNQKTYILEAETAGDACSAAGEKWRNEDETVTARQRDKGIYAIAARHAKFGETRQQLVVPVTAIGDTALDRMQEPGVIEAVDDALRRVRGSEA